jgi:hypothetical protein
LYKKEGRSEDEEDLGVMTLHKKEEQNRTEHTRVAFIFLTDDTVSQQSR